MLRVWQTMAAMGLVLAIVTGAQAGGIKKWVDEEGVVHYGTAIPPRYIDQEHRELNERGIEVKHTERSKTAAEIAREDELKRLRAEKARILEEQRARDRILLSVYRSEDDLLMIRDGKLAQLDAQIKYKRSEIARLKKRLASVQAIAAEQERQGRSLDNKRQEDLDSVHRQLEQAYSSILTRENEKTRIVAHYDRDLQRLQVLLQTAGRSAEHIPEQTQTENTSVDTVVICTTHAECDKLWPLAQDYTKQNATTAPELYGQRILVMAPPRNDQDISITVSRIADKDGESERIFLDVECHNSVAGTAFCRDDAKVHQIRAGFRPALLGQ